MANIKITDLTAYTDAASTDVMPIVDIGNNVTKKISISDLLKTAPSGTAGAPGIAFDGDPNTGIYRPGADQVAISTNGTGRLFVDASGSVGVGATPSYQLDVVNAGESNVRIKSGGAASAYLRLGTASKDYTLYVDAASGALNIYDITAATTRLTLTSTGALGLGTSSAGYKLDTTVNTNGFDGYNAYGGQGGVSEFIGYRAVNPNNVGLVAGVSGFAASSAIAGANLPALYTLGNVGLAFGTNSVERMRLTSTGLGIGTTAPSADLSIGDIYTTASRQIRLHGPASGTAGGASLNVVNGTDTVFAAGNASNIIGGTYSSDAMLFWGNSALRFYGNSSERARIDSSGRLLVGTSTDSGGALLQVNGDRIRIGTAKTPASASATGTAGEICWDTSYIYVCTATNTWKRAALATW